jgi:hypothetical protein
MGFADTVEYWMDELVKGLNRLSKESDGNPAYAQALEDAADHMGVTIKRAVTFKIGD